MLSRVVQASHVQKNRSAETRTARLVQRKKGVLMRRLLEALCTLLALALVGPVLVSAQDATPEADVGGAEVHVERTDVRYLLPFGPDGLSGGLTASATVEGVCGFNSSAALDRPDAWDCISTDSEIFDPCFENPIVSPDEVGELACFDAPCTPKVTLLPLTEPLVREKQAPDRSGDPSMAMGQQADDILAPWDLPRALEQANGDRCTLMHGTLTVMAGQIVSYGC